MGVTESLTFAVKRYGAPVDAADVGVPLITPVTGFNDKPGGRGDGLVGLGRLNDHAYGFVPPVACSCGAEE